MEAKTKKTLLWLLDIAVNAIVILILVIVIQKWLVAPFDVSGKSMCDTLNIVNGECAENYGEKIILNEAGYLFNEPERGDIVVFKPNEEWDKYFIKRVIGLPGETVEIKDGNVYVTTVNGEFFQLEEEYLNAENEGKTIAAFSDYNVFHVPENQYFVLGDNRNNSTDSRSCFMGVRDVKCKQNPEQSFVSRELIRGKAWVVWWPLANLRIISNPDYAENSESLEEK